MSYLYGIRTPLADHSRNGEKFREKFRGSPAHSIRLTQSTERVMPVLLEGLGAQCCQRGSEGVWVVPGILWWVVFVCMDR